MTGDLNPARERSALQISLAGALVMTGWAIGFHVLTGSEAIRLDALFNGITTVMSVLALRIASLIQGSDSQRFQFGHYSFEALLNTIKGLIILFVCVGAALSSVQVIVGGGREFELDTAAVYAVSATAICSIVARSLHRRARMVGSPLLDLDAFNWRVNALISAAVAVAFLVAWALEGTRWRWLAAYVDPVLVLLLVLAVMKFPVDVIRRGVFQLLLAAPSSELQGECSARLSAALGSLPGGRVEVRMSHVGRLVYVLVQVLVGEDGDGPRRLDDQDRVRERIASALEGLHPELIVDVLFTAQPRWLD